MGFENDYILSLEAMVEALEGTVMPGGLKRVKPPWDFYPSADGYDPVLAWHCRLVGEVPKKRKEEEGR